MSEKKQDKASRGRHAADASHTQENDQQAVFVAPTASEIPDAFGAMPPAAAPARRHKPLKVLGIIFGVIIALLLAAYVGLAVYFMGHFMPNSNIGNIDVSLMDSTEATSALADSGNDYKLSISGKGFALNLTASDAGLSLDAASVVANALSEVNPWKWPLELRGQHDGTTSLVASYNGTGLEDAIRAAVDGFNATATQPTNATIVYDGASHVFVVQPEAVGTALNVDAIIAAADKAIISLAEKVELTNGELVQPTVLATDPKLAQAVAKANTMITADLTLTMGGASATKVNADLISQWVRLDDELTATLDEEALTAWVDDLVSKCDTVGTERTYTRPDGKVISVAGGPYGWLVDRDALLDIVKESVSAGSVQTVETPCTSTGAAYSGVGTQDWGARYCDVDLAEQYVRFYDESGALVWESACISGIPDGQHDTSTGVYWLNQKASPSKLIGYENGRKIYESTVQYWMPFVGNAIGLHDADWQPDFGGSMYANGYGSHGCVNLPPYKAAELYGIIQTGDVVVSHW